MKTFVGENVPDGWFLNLEQAKASVPEKVVSDEVQAKCDDRLSHQWGFTLASFIKLHNYTQDQHRTKRFRPIFDKVLAGYGDKIHKVKRGSTEVWKWRQQPQ
jgi:hypothetical protein